MGRLALLVLAVAALASAGTATAAPVSPSAVVQASPSIAATVSVREVRGSTVPTSASTRSSEPAVAADPLDARRLALVYLHGSGPVQAVVRISHDGGITWRAVRANPGGGGYHLMVAWGPGPVAGHARLYFANMTGSGGGLRLMTRYSDNEGNSWSAPRIQSDTPPWVGGTPDLTVDTNPASPSYGVVYAAYNWPRSATRGPGLHIIASGDYGRTFHAVEVPALPTTARYPVGDRIGYRLRTAPDGGLYVVWYQADLRYWRSSDPLSKGSLSNIGRIRFGVARLVYDRAARTWQRGPSLTAATLPRTAWNAGFVRPGGLTNDPQWSPGIVVDPSSGHVLLALSVDGGIRVYSSADQGRTWTYRSLPSPLAVRNRAQWIAKPDLVIGTGFLAVTMRMLDRTGATSTHAYSVSVDAGLTWSRPHALGSARWASAPVSGPINGVGLRNRAVVTADGKHIVFAYGDGRYGAYGVNRSAVFVSTITVTIPVAPSPTPVATPSPDPTGPADPSLSASPDLMPTLDPSLPASLSPDPSATP